MKNITKFVLAVVLSLGLNAIAQKTMGPSSFGELETSTQVKSIADQIRLGTAKFAENIPQKGHPKLRHGNKSVPGKGLPKGNDPLLGKQAAAKQVLTKSPDLIFTADVSTSTPSDPTGAAGPNHYLGAWNNAFRIFDKATGDPLTPEMALGTLFPGNNAGDPIVFYDANVDNGPGQPRGRFVVTEFDREPNGFNVAVSAGPDPINDPWNIYTMNLGTGVFPDYTKFAIWGDAYIVTANIMSGPTGDKVFAVDREAMIAGAPNGSVGFIGFPLPGIAINGFYSPHGFHTTADQAVPPGTPAPIVYMQDDAWAGVNEDHLRIWEATIDFDNPANSSISVAQELSDDEGVSPFVSVFDGGSFENRPQGGGVDIDVLQATVMNQVQYRRFGTHNSVVLNFVVDVLEGDAELAAIRWYELRQTADGEPWTVYQEGTYTAPDGRDAYSGSMVMNSDGAIAMAYTSSSEIDRISIRYTGRFDSDALGVMSVSEQLIAQSTGVNPVSRLADYVHLTNDPADDSFWHIAEYFGGSRRDVVANFTLQEPIPNDIGIQSIDAPTTAVLTDSEIVTVSIRNFGSNPITDPMLQYTVDGGEPIVEQFTGTIGAGATESFSFATPVDLSVSLQTYELVVTTLLSQDSNTANDSISSSITNSEPVCTPIGSCSAFNDGVTILELVDQSLSTICGEDTQGYSDDRQTIFTFNTFSDTFSGNLQMGFNDSIYAIWIDFNDNAIFESNEVVSSEQVANGNENFSFTIDVSAFTTEQREGSHIMRVRGEDESGVGDVLDACGQLQFGRTNDYIAFFNPILSVVESDVFEGSEFGIYEIDKNIFDVNLRSSFEGNAAISVFNLAGQQLVFNNLDKSGDSYNYQLDMSFASKGVYIVQFEDADGVGRVAKKIIVK